MAHTQLRLCINRHASADLSVERSPIPRIVTVILDSCQSRAHPSNLHAEDLAALISPFTGSEKLCVKLLVTKFCKPSLNFFSI